MPLIKYNGIEILFIHIPKTGGSSVEEWLKSIAPLELFSQGLALGENRFGLPAQLPCTPQHLVADDIYRFRPEGFDFAFTVVRNPYARLESEFKFKKIADRDRNIYDPIEFGEWVASLPALVRSDPFCRDNHIRPQADFLHPEVKIYRYEEGLDAIVASVAKLLGMPQPSQLLPRVLDGSAFNAAVVWDQRAIDIARELYAVDFNRLGYSTEKRPDT